MNMRASTIGAIIGIAVATVILVVAGVLLLNTGGANWKVLVAVWLWALPVMGICSGFGYGAGKVVDRLGSARPVGAEGGMHTDV